jgi:hypothetical protein
VRQRQGTRLIVGHVALDPYLSFGHLRADRRLRILAEIRGQAMMLQMEHSPTSSIGTSWEKIPWHAVQRAALDAFKRAESG